MAQPVVEDPVLRQRYSFSRRTGVEGVVVLVVAAGGEPGGGVPPHAHPVFEERFEVLDGEITFLAGRRHQRATAGEKVVVPAGLRHAYRNSGDGPGHLVAEVHPGHPDLQGFLEDAAALARAGKFNRYALPTSLDGALRASVLIQRYRDTTVLHRPPRWLQRVALAPLARVAARRGYTADRLGAAA
jgi:quercetin dioxygenase-like cupin family protein